MHFMPTSIALLLASASALASTNTKLPGFTYAGDAGQNVVWPNLPILICASSRIPTRVRDSLPGAIEVWNKTFYKEIFKTGCKLGSENYTETGLSERGIYWITKKFEDLTDKTSLARTVVQYDENGVVLDADILLNGQYYDWNRVDVDPKTILLHELGHALGMKHFFLSTDSAMNYYPYVGGYQHHTLGEYEKLVFKTLYLNQSTKIPPYLKFYFAGDIPKAISALKKLKKITFDELYALAILQSTLKDHTVARDNFAKLVAQKPDSTLVRQKYAESLWSSGDNEGAEREFLKVIEKNPKSYEALANLGGLYLQKGDADKAVKYLKQSLTIQPAHWVACEMLYAQTKIASYKACVNKYGPATTKP